MSNSGDIHCGIVILNYNDYATTVTLLKLIKDYDSISNIVVVDNFSTDNSYVKLLEHESEKIKILLAPGNNGYSKGNNIGIRYLIENTDVDIICISNSDVEFDNDLVVRILAQFERHKDYAIITALQVAPNGEIANRPFWPEYSNKQYFYTKAASLKLFSKILKKSYTKEYIESKLKKGSFFRVGAVDGSFFFIRKKDFIKIGLLDEGVWIYFEEDILAKKIKHIQKKIGVDTSVKYVHYGAKTLKKVASSNIWINHMFHSAVYYFDHYQSNNIILQKINYILCNIIRIEGISSFWLYDHFSRMKNRLNKK